MKRVALFATMLAVSLASAPAHAGLEQEKDINDGLFVIAIADKIRRACDSIGARIFVAKSYVDGLKQKANDRGYTDKEINAHIEDKEKRAKMRAWRNSYFESKGASNLDPESLCVLGRSEIASETAVGKLLRLK
ncbi:MAG: DUF5333 domain-containing protein [Pseudomonadota bacterium]